MHRSPPPLWWGAFWRCKGDTPSRSPVPGLCRVPNSLKGLLAPIGPAPREGLEPLISTVVALYPSVSYLGHQACDLVYCAED